MNNARAFHLDSLIGTVDVGKRANMVLMTKNPLEELEAYDNIESIILEMVLSPPTELAAIQSKCRQLGFDMASDEKAGSLLRTLEIVNRKSISSVQPVLKISYLFTAYDKV